MTNTTTYEHVLDGEPCASGPERHDDALCAEHGRQVRRTATMVQASDDGPPPYRTSGWQEA